MTLKCENYLNVSCYNNLDTVSQSRNLQYVTRFGDGNLYYVIYLQARNHQ